MVNELELHSDSSCNHKNYNNFNEHQHRHIESEAATENSTTQKKICNIAEQMQNNTLHVTKEFRTSPMDPLSVRNSSIRNEVSPKTEIKLSAKIKRETMKTDFPNPEFGAYNRTIKSPPNTLEEKNAVNKFGYNGDSKNNNTSIKREIDNFKTENDNVNDESNKSTEGEGPNQNNSIKSANSSPYRDKRRKKMLTGEEQQILSLTHQDRLNPDFTTTSLQKPLVTKMYYSYFERTDDNIDEIREMK